jgi:hypothetical protein
VVSGVGAAVFGIAALVRPDLGVRAVTAVVGAETLSWILAALWMLAGLSAAAIATRVTGAARIGFAAFGVASALAGVAFRIWPGGSAGALVVFVGIGAVAVGVWLIAVAVQLREE